VTLVYAFSVRALLGERRSIALALLAASAGGIAVLTSLLGDDFAAENDFAQLVTRLLIPTVTAFVALVVAASAFGEEREDGSILYLAATPVSRLTIVAAKVLAAWTATLAILVPALLGFAVLGASVEDGGPRVLGWTFLAVALSSLAYSAFFVFLSLAMRRAVIAGILYIALWEGSVASFAASAGNLSIGAYGRVVAHEATPDVILRGLIDAAPLTALLVLVGVVVVGTLLGARRLGRMELP
jgi:ABC-2 type transport system permease protein